MCVSVKTTKLVQACSWRVVIGKFQVKEADIDMYVQLQYGYTMASVSACTRVTIHCNLSTKLPLDQL